jgi:hypothetical protein
VNEAGAKHDAETGTDMNESVVSVLSIEEFMADPNLRYNFYSINLEHRGHWSQLLQLKIIC